jgi:hypothetical protein
MLKTTDTHPNWRDKRMFSPTKSIIKINVIRWAQGNGHTKTK